VVNLPLVKSQEPASFAALDTAIEHLGDYGLLIFTSTTVSTRFSGASICSAGTARS
jgi:hypothetical protein